MIRKQLTTVFALAIAAALGGAAHAQQVVGFVAATEGSVEIRTGGATSFEVALVDRDVSIGDVIRTGALSATKIVLADETIVTLGEESELEIDSFVVGAAATRDPSVLRLLKGRARAVIGEAFGGPSNVEMHTPTAVIGVKGSAYDAYVIDEGGEKETLVCNVGGHIFVRLLDPQQGEVEPPEELCWEAFQNRFGDEAIPRPDRYPPIDALSGPGSGDKLPPVGAGPGSALLVAPGGGNDPLPGFDREGDFTPDAFVEDPGDSVLLIDPDLGPPGGPAGIPPIDGGPGDEFPEPPPQGEEGGFGLRIDVGVP